MQIGDLIVEIGNAGIPKLQKGERNFLTSKCDGICYFGMVRKLLGCWIFLYFFEFQCLIFDTGEEQMYSLK